MTATNVEMHPELLAAAVLQGQRDAENVGLYLTTLIAGMKERNLLDDDNVDLSMLPGAWLLDLGAALRLVEWDSQDLARPHLGLPPAQASLTAVLQRWGQPDPQLTLCRTVLSAYFTHFAWNGILDLGADMVLEPLDEELFATQVAEFLWRNRDSLEQRYEESNAG